MKPGFIMGKYACHTQITRGKLVICSTKAPRKQKVWEDFHAFIWLVVLLCFFVILGIEPRILHLLGKYSIVSRTWKDIPIGPVVQNHKVQVEFNIGRPFFH